MPAAPRCRTMPVVLAYVLALYVWLFVAVVVMALSRPHRTSADMRK
jgi:hypothetical protein